MYVKDGNADVWVEDGGHQALKCLCSAREVSGVSDGVCSEASVEVGRYPSDCRV